MFNMLLGSINCIYICNILFNLVINRPNYLNLKFMIYKYLHFEFST